MIVAKTVVTFGSTVLWPQGRESFRDSLIIYLIFILQSIEIIMSLL